MQTSTGAWTKAQAERRSAMYQLGCICCRDTGKWSQVQIHHILDDSGESRLGHDETIPLCPYHHTGDTLLASRKEMELYGFGPPGPPGGADFVAAFGTEQELLDQVNDLLARLFRL